MTTFSRSFAVDVLAEWDATSPGNAVRELFDRWYLPGEKAFWGTPLRLGLGDGELNLYAKGQLIAKLTCGPSGPNLSVHSAYVTGRRRQWVGDGNPPVQGYQDYDANALADPATSSLIADWIKTAETYASAEQRFVDDLIAANPAVLNLETSVPASDFEDIGGVAPRMSLVVVQHAGDGPPSIGFWQVLSASNPDLRARDDDPPEVLEQIAQCARWMAEDHRKAEVERAHRNMAASLLDLYRLFRAGDRSERKSARIWQELTKAEAPVVIVQPGLVIGNYWPEGYREPDRQRPDGATCSQICWEPDPRRTSARRHSRS